MLIRIVPKSYPTIQAAVDSALPGDEIHVNDGIYKEQVTITHKAGLGILAVDNNAALDGSGFAQSAIGFHIVDSPGVKITGFIIKGFNKGIIVDSPSDNSTIMLNVIKDIKDDGIKVKADKCSIINNSVYNCADDGVKVNANSCSVKGNFICSNGEEGIEVHGDRNTLIGNTVKNNCGIGIEIIGENNTVSRNIVNNNSTDIKSSGIDNLIISNNCRNMQL